MFSLNSSKKLSTRLHYSHWDRAPASPSLGGLKKSCMPPCTKKRTCTYKPYWVYRSIPRFNARARPLGSLPRTDCWNLNFMMEIGRCAQNLSVHLGRSQYAEWRQFSKIWRLTSSTFLFLLHTYMAVPEVLNKSVEWKCPATISWLYVLPEAKEWFLRVNYGLDENDFCSAWTVVAVSAVGTGSSSISTYWCGQAGSTISFNFLTYYDQTPPFCPPHPPACQSCEWIFGLPW